MIEITILTVWTMVCQWLLIGIDTLNYCADSDYFNQLENLKGM